MIVLLLLRVVWIQFLISTKVDIVIEFICELLLWRQQIIAQVVRLLRHIAIRNIRLWGRCYVHGVPRIVSRLRCWANKRTRSRRRVLVVVDQCCWSGGCVNGNRSWCCGVAVVALRERCRRDNG